MYLESAMTMQQAQQLAGRNDHCSCGSGKKFKKCCMGKAGRASASSSGQFEQQLNAALSWVARQNYAEAEKHFRALLSIRKDSELVSANLGQCLCQLHRSKEGIPYLYQAGKSLLRKARQTGDATDLFDLTYQLIHWHGFEEALALAESVLALAPDSVQAHHLAALALQGLNRRPGALAHATRAVELAPHEANAQILLATLESKAGNLVDSRRRLEPIAALGSGAEAARANLELGIILDKCGEYDKAFAHVTEAGKITLNTPAAQRIDKTAVYREIGLYQSAFDGQFLRSSADRVAPDGLPSPVFLIGFYRSGTTLAEQVLAAHPQVISSDETHLIGQVLSELSRIAPGATLPDRIKSLDTTQISHLRQYYWAIAEKELGVQVLQRVMVDKTTLNTLNVELINTLFPDALLIFAVRDPRDVCLSCLTTSFVLSPLTIHLLSWEDCARLYALLMGYWISIRDTLSLRWVELRYEDVVADLEGQFRPLFVKMGLEWSNACREFHGPSQKRLIKTPSFDQVTRPLYTSSAGRWRNYQEHYSAILPLLKPFVTAFGY